jgi:hypothetical protein
MPGWAGGRLAWGCFQALSRVRRDAALKTIRAFISLNEARPG